MSLQARAIPDAAALSGDHHFPRHPCPFAPCIFFNFIQAERQAWSSVPARCSRWIPGGVNTAIHTRTPACMSPTRPPHTRTHAHTHAHTPSRTSAHTRTRTYIACTHTRTHVHTHLPPTCMHARILTRPPAQKIQLLDPCAAPHRPIADSKQNRLVLLCPTSVTKKVNGVKCLAVNSQLWKDSTECLGLSCPPPRGPSDGFDL